MIRSLFYVEELNRGGLETFCMNVLRASAGTDLKFSFLVLKEGEYDYAKEAEDLDASVSYLLKEWDSTGRSSRISNLFKQTKAMYSWIKAHKNDFDVLHFNASHLANSFPLILSAKIGGVKTIVLHSHSSNESNSLNRILHQAFRLFLPCLSLSKYLACSREAGDWMFGKHAKYEIVNNGIDFNNYRFDLNARTTIRSDLGIEDNDTVFIYVARFASLKNHSFLIDVFKEILDITPRAKLLLCGRGPCEDEIRHKAESLGVIDSIEFLGVREDIPALLSAADCFVFPSLYEGLPVSAVEAQINSLPLVISDCVSLETVLSDKTTIVPLSLGANHWASIVMEAAAERFIEPDFKSEIRDYDINEVDERLFGVYEQAMAHE